MSALEFHHIGNKDFTISGLLKQGSYDIDEYKTEIDKCQLLCSCCHAETHDIENQSRESNERVSYVKNKRHQTKEDAIYVMGGKCACCGKTGPSAIFDFHHLVPSEKDFIFSHNGAYSWDKIAPELKKCVLLCRNCHREIHSGLRTIDTTKTYYSQERYDEKTREHEHKHKQTSSHKAGRVKRTIAQHHCASCGKEISHGATLCTVCAGKSIRKVERPDYETLKEEIRQYPFLTLAKKYRVSDNAIKKWCNFYGLPSKKSDINGYSDEEWEREVWNESGGYVKQKVHIATADEILECYKRTNSLEKVSQELHCDSTRTAAIVRSAGFTVSQVPPKAVVSLDDNGKVIDFFPSVKAASRSLGITHSHIADVCQGKYRTAHGLRWRFATDAEIRRFTKQQ